MAQLVRASHRYRGVTGSNPVEILKFSGFYIRNCTNCVHNYENRSLLVYTSAVQNMKYFIYDFTEELLLCVYLTVGKAPSPFSFFIISMIGWELRCTLIYSFWDLRMIYFACNSCCTFLPWRYLQFRAHRLSICGFPDCACVYVSPIIPYLTFLNA